MAIQFWMRDGTAWRSAKEVWLRDGTTWRKAKEIWTRDATTWHRVFGATINGSFNASLTNTAATTGLRGASLTLNSDGTASTSPSSATPNWLTSTGAGAGSSYWVRLTPVGASNTNITGMAPGSWYDLGSARQVTVQNNSASNLGTGHFTLDFATDSAGANIIATLTNAVSWEVGFAP